jgi:Tfp pilus assembly protein PilO
VILCRKPFPIYHIDAVGVLGLLALMLAGWWLALAPWRQTCASCRELGQRRATLESELQAQSEKLERAVEDLAWLQGVIDTQVVEEPRADSVPQLLREMTELAGEVQIELLSVVPQPAVPEGAYVVSDIQFTGRGRSPSFIRFLDRLAQQNPFQALTNCSLKRAAGAADETCDLSWTLRLYMLPATAGEGEGTQ